MIDRSKGLNIDIDKLEILKTDELLGGTMLRNKDPPTSVYAYRTHREFMGQCRFLVFSYTLPCQVSSFSAPYSFVFKREREKKILTCAT